MLCERSTNLGIYIWYLSFVGGKDGLVMPDCTSVDDTPFLPVIDAKLGNDFLAIASAENLFSPLLFFVRLGLLAVPSEVNVCPPESAVKGSVTGSSEVPVSCLNHSSDKLNALLVADSTEFLHISSQVGGIVSYLICETVENVLLYTMWYCGDTCAVTGLIMSDTDHVCMVEWPK